MPEILSHIGNLELLERPKTAFLCSSKTTSRDILKSFDWATSVPKDLEGTKRSVYLRESPKMMEEPRIEIVR